MKLSELLYSNNRIVNTPCGGNGTCGKCLVRIKGENIPISTMDKSALSDEELAKGYRLACQMQVDDSFDLSQVEIIDTPEEMEVLTVDAKPSLSKQSGHYGIAIDIGSTTLAFALLEGDRILDSYGCPNKQASMGADIISRIDAAINGRAEALHKLLIDGLNEGIDLLLNRNNISKDALKKLVVAGNTTMLHLLFNYSLMGLSRYPFEPVFLSIEKRNACQILSRDDLPNTELIALPGISAFVGADIVAGLYYLEAYDYKEDMLLLDLGTNGEMALVKEDEIVVTSTAAGPAFEGVNISCGKPSISGAIYDVTIDNIRRPGYKTIGDRMPIGICGSGLLAAVSEMLDKGIIDSNGSYSDSYIDKGYPLIGNIIISPKDVREFQMAKSAIRSGMDILVKEAADSDSKEMTIYLAGGFGSGIDVDKATNVGLIDKKLHAHIKGIGNTSLLGAIKFLSDDKAEEKCNDIIRKSREIVLANTEEFNDIYIRNLNF